MPSYLDYHGLETLKTDLESLYIKKAQRGVNGGVATLDNTGKVPSAQLPDIGGSDHPVFTGSISLGRKANTTVGTGSVAFGNETAATGNYSQAEGDGSSASGRGAHAEGASITTYDAELGQDVVVPVTADGDGTHAEGIATKATDNAAHAEGMTTTASNDAAHAEGYNTTASGMYAHSEGNGTVSSGNAAHAEGRMTEASGLQSHAEGVSTQATANAAHAEGSSSIASGSSSHAEGEYTTASAQASHAEGQRTKASGLFSHSEGSLTEASGDTSHAEGRSTKAKGRYTHAEGESTIAAGDHSHVSGRYNVEDNVSSWPEYAPGTLYYVGDKVKVTTGEIDPATQQFVNVSRGYVCKQQNSDNSMISTKWYEAMNYAEIVGNGLSASTRSNARTLDWEGNERLAGDLYVGCNADSTGGSKVATADNPVFTGSISLGRRANTTIGNNSSAIGTNSEASGNNSHAEGNGTASGAYSHAEGMSSIASGDASHAEGSGNAIGNNSHAEGIGTFANAMYSHCEGQQTSTNSNAIGSHTEGLRTVAIGRYSHAEGEGTTANGSYSHVSGMYNKADVWEEWRSGAHYDVGNKVSIHRNEGYWDTYICTQANSDTEFSWAKWTDLDGKATYAEIIGNGTAMNARSNARTLDWEGNERLKGDLYVGCNADSTGGKKVVTETDLDLKADKANPVFTGSISMGRKANTTIGYNSTALGGENEASASYSSAFGYLNKVSGQYSAVCGYGTSAIGRFQKVIGRYNKEDIFPTWTANTHYNVGDKVIRLEHTEFGDLEWHLRCITENTDASYVSSNWEQIDPYIDSNFVEIVGNGTADNARSNARTLDWEGNERLKGDLYVGCNADSTGGTKVATLTDLTSKADTANPVFTGSISMDRYGNAGSGSVAVGSGNEASGAQSFAEGRGTTASGTVSHAEGEGTKSTHKAQHVFGTYNKEDPSVSAGTAKGTYIEIVGNGTDAPSNKRSNARTLDWNGNEALAGSLTLGMGTANEVTITAAQLAQLLALLNYSK